MPPKFRKRPNQPITPTHYRRAAAELRRCADRIEADADPQDARARARLSGAVVGAYRAAEALHRADIAVTYCERCDDDVVVRDDQGDAVCARCGLML